MTEKNGLLENLSNYKTNRCIVQIIFFKIILLIIHHCMEGRRNGSQKWKLNRRTDQIPPESVQYCSIELENSIDLWISDACSNGFLNSRVELTHYLWMATGLGGRNYLIQNGRIRKEAHCHFPEEVLLILKRHDIKYIFHNV